MGEGDKSNLHHNEYHKRLAENVEGFQQFLDEIFKAIEQDENFTDMTAESYDQKKSYIKAHLLELSFIHNSLAAQYSHLIEEVSKNCPSLLQKQHLKSSHSSSFTQVTQMLAPKVTSGFDVFCHPGGGGSASSSTPQVIQTLAPKVTSGYDVFCHWVGSGYASSSSPQVIQMLAPKVTSGFDIFCHWVGSGFAPSLSPQVIQMLPPKVTSGSSVFCHPGSNGFSLSDLESLMPSANKPSIPPVNDDDIKETKDFGSESFMSSVNQPKLEMETKEEELKADEHMSRVLEEKNQSKHDSEIKEMNMKITQYVTEISQLKSTYENKEKVWNDVTRLLKYELHEQSELVDELSKKMNRKDDQLELLWAEKRSQDILIQQLKTELDSVKLEHAGLLSSFDNVRKLTNELKLKVVELEKEVVRQREAMSNKD